MGGAIIGLFIGFSLYRKHHIKNLGHGIDEYDSDDDLEEDSESEGGLESDEEDDFSNDYEEEEKPKPKRREKKKSKPQRSKRLSMNSTTMKLLQRVKNPI